LATATCSSPPSAEIEAHLSVLVVALAAPPPISEYAAMVSDAWLDQRQEDLRELQKKLAAVSTDFAASPLSTDVASVYAEMAWADEAIGRRARYADLTIVGPDMLSRDVLKEKTIEGALSSSGKPILLVPDGSRPTLRPKLPISHQVQLIGVYPREISAADMCRRRATRRLRHRSGVRALWPQCGRVCGLGDFGPGPRRYPYVCKQFRRACRRAVDPGQTRPTDVLLPFRPFRLEKKVDDWDRGDSRWHSHMVGRAAGVRPSRSWNSTPATLKWWRKWHATSTCR